MVAYCRPELPQHLPLNLNQAAIKSDESGIATGQLVADPVAMGIDRIICTHVRQQEEQRSFEPRAARTSSIVVRATGFYTPWI